MHHQPIGAPAGVAHHPAAPDPSMIALARALGGFPLAKLATFVEVAIGLFDAIEGDTDRELDDDRDDFSLAEDEPLGLNSLEHGPGCPLADPPEVDDGDTSGDEGEPDFRRRRWHRSYGAGCMISDPDYGGEEAGEVDEGDCGYCMRHGIDQTRPVGADNPEFR